MNVSWTLPKVPGNAGNKTESLIDAKPHVQPHFQMGYDRKAFMTPESLRASDLGMLLKALGGQERSTPHPHPPAASGALEVPALHNGHPASGKRSFFASK